MEAKYELSSNYIALLDQIRYLLSRENLCNNTYLFKQMKPNLTLPLFLIAEERKIAAITNNEQLIINALNESRLAKVQNNRDVVLFQYPTLKISTKKHEIFQEIEKALRQKDVKYSFSQRGEKEYVNLTVYSEDIESLQQLLNSLSKQIDFERVSLYEDMRAGVSRIKKIKQQHKNSNNNNNNYLGKTKYSLDKPPQIFIRRSVPSEDQQQEQKNKSKLHDRNRKKYKQVTKQENKPKFSNEDFPSLT